MSLLQRVARPSASSLGAALLLVPCVVGCQNHAESEGAALAPTVSVALAATSDAGRTVRLSGTIEADRTLALGFAQPGTVEAVLVQEGDAVKRGQPLARLGVRALSDSVGIARAKSLQAEDAIRRLEPMHKSQTLPEIKWVEAETGREQARLMVSIAQKNLEDAILRAPEDGIVARRQIEAGASVLPGAPAITLVTAQRMLAIAPIAEAQIGRVKVGQPASVKVSATGKTFQGAVREIGVVADPLTRTYPLKVAVEGIDPSLRYGMVADVHLQEPGGGSAIVVPPAAVRIDEKGATYVYVVAADEKAHRAAVTVTGFVGERTAVTGDIQPGARVVTSGTAMLSEGTAVRITSEATKPEVPR